MSDKGIGTDRFQLKKTHYLQNKSLSTKFNKNRINGQIQVLYRIHFLNDALFFIFIFFTNFCSHRDLRVHVHNAECTQSTFERNNRKLSCYSASLDGQHQSTLSSPSSSELKWAGVIRMCSSSLV